jgi:hypothetical protein
VEEYLVVNEEAIKRPTMNDGHIKRFGEDGRFPKREWHLSREW